MYNTREQRQHLRWQERQRKKQQSNSKKSERGTVEMSNKPDMSAFIASLGSIEINVKFDQTKEREKKAQESLDRLIALPGMDHIKGQVEQIIALKKVTEKRKAAGLKCEQQSLHMVFAGAPGTGKTTAARLIGEAFIHMGMLKSTKSVPPFVEIHLNDIESKYLGEAEENMKKKFMEARGGVLFMDEAYSFGGPYHHNKTFLANLVSMIEDMRDEVLVIAAGYSDQMQGFLDENPGLRSRFSNVIDFPDYEIGHLLEIADMMAKDRDYDITGPCRTQLIARLTKEKKLKSFGNARTVRNVIEQSIRLHAVRMAGIENPTRDQLMSLTGVDIDTEVKIPPKTENKSSMHGDVVGIITMSEKSKKEPFNPGDFH